MKSWIACGLAVLLWIGIDAMARNREPGQGGPAQVKENAPQPEKPPEGSRPPAEAGAKDAAKDSKGARDSVGNATAGGPRPGGPQGTNAQRPSGALEKGKSQGKGGAGPGQTFQKQVQHEDAKHMERHAKLVRIRELAVQKGDKEMLARVDKLMEKEQQVYGRKVQRLQGQPRATRQPPANSQPGAAPAAKPDATKGPQGAPDAKKPTGDQKPPK
jgi:hypothetical protein